MSQKPTYDELLQRVREYEQKETQWRQTLAALQDSEERQRQIIETSNAGYFFVDLEGRFQQVNPAWLKMHKYNSPDEVIGRHFSLTQVKGESPRARDIVERVLTDGAVLSGEFSRLCKDGSVGWHTFTVKDVRRGGQTVGIEGFILDTTERRRTEEALKESEEKYRLLFENMLNGFALHQTVLDEDGQPVDYAYLEVNAAFERLTGLKRADILGKRVTEALPGIEKDPADWIGRYGRVALTGREERFEHYAQPLGKWFSVLAYSPKKGYFATIFQDVSDRKRTEQALREKIRQLDLVLSNAPIVLSAVDREGRFILSEGKGLEALGREPGNMVGTSVFDLYRDAHPDILEYVGRAMAGEQVEAVVELAGEVFQAHYSPIRRENGEISGVVVVANIVTERKRAAQALRESEERFRAAFMGNPLGVVISRRDNGDWVDINQPALDMFGYTREEIIGKSALDTKFWVDLEDRKGVVAAMAEFGEVRDREVRLLHKDGRMLTVSISVRPLTLQGEDHLLFIAEDVTERRRAEAERQKLQKQLADAVELAHLGHWEYDVASDVFTFNDQFYKIFHTTAQEVGGYAMSSAEYAERFVHPEDRHVVAGEVRKAIETDDPDYRGHLEHRMLYANGRTGHISVLLFIVKDAQGRTIRTYGVNQDITERKTIQERLLKAEKMDALGTLSSGIAHDFNNILAAILGYSELAQDDLPPGHPARHNIAQITRAADRAKHLVRQILTFSRKAETYQKPISLNHTVKDAAALLERTIPKMIRLQLDLGEDLAPIKADERQMEQLLLNLAGNAADAMEGGGVISVSTRNVTLDRLECEVCGNLLSGDYVLLSVQDTGPGMNPETKARIFDPFFTTKEVGKGTGLGLSTVYGIVTGHSGHIMCHSQLGMGTEFRVYLPAAEAEPLADETGDQPSAPPRGGDETILVADDEASIREIAGQILTGSGYQVLTAGNGEEALEIFRGDPGRIHLVLLDLGMPGMGGKACLSKMRGLAPEAKVLIASGYIQYELSDELKLLGALRMVSKPYRKAELLKKVREVLDG